MTKLSMISAAMLGVTMAVAPLSAFAKDNHPGKGKGHNKQVRIESRDAPVVRHDHTIVVANCPPGLAKKDPACVPPGQAKKGLHREVAVGDIYDLDDIHIITRPGLYGLGEPPEGNRYAIVDGRLVRVDSETGRLLSIIRLVNAILD